ncbi:uncharacterized protein K452DRAFT_62360 [Aplosporella prunicola CBS 121167]|uniref:Uncharacterized protein n=1 Tax=Aplosporella prunicola CBS 121167 TaxID=1176127 RepID=A0A6A6B8H0_9PEZI|nr:uncharacterized protein K452DRAFT_62360 [Aplosporella prunicola CBS 121167]KAF2139565.1 hypothetical protein K452DRAFT_62360 [Aplosporella prunicola CBS 121167]
MVQDTGAHRYRSRVISHLKRPLSLCTFIFFYLVLPLVASAAYFVDGMEALRDLTFFFFSLLFYIFSFLLSFVSYHFIWRCCFLHRYRWGFAFFWRYSLDRRRRRLFPLCVCLEWQASRHVASSSLVAFLVPVLVSFGFSCMGSLPCFAPLLLSSSPPTPRPLFARFFFFFFFTPLRLSPFLFVCLPPARSASCYTPWS